MGDVHTRIRRIKLYHLKFYGLLHCDISNYENYTMDQLIDEFCSVVPCFFSSYNELAHQFTNNFKQCNTDMVQLCADLLLPPAAHIQAKLALILHEYFLGLVSV